MSHKNGQVKITQTVTRILIHSSFYIINFLLLPCIPNLPKLILLHKRSSGPN